MGSEFLGSLFVCVSLNECGAGRSLKWQNELHFGMFCLIQSLIRNTLPRLSSLFSTVSVRGNIPRYTPHCYSSQAPRHISRDVRSKQPLDTSQPQAPEALNLQMPKHPKNTSRAQAAQHMPAPKVASLPEFPLQPIASLGLCFSCFSYKVCTYGVNPSLSEIFT